MTTLEVGQLVEQTNVGRVWRLDSFTTSVNGTNRWRITLITPSPTDDRMAGVTTTASETWLNERCRDWTPPRIDPPQGDGVQVMQFVSDGVAGDGRQFTTAAAMLAWTLEQFEALDDSDMVGHWFGWDATDDAAPDMTVTWDGNELVWAEA